MSERKLATIRRVSAVHDIPGKDRIGLAQVDGWTVIVQKADIHAGDLVVFCEIDSVLPNEEWCSFLKDHRIRTMKMAGCLSQGIAFPLSILPDGLDVMEGDDVTEILGVTKWERPDAEDVRELINPTAKKKFPKWLLRMMRKPWFRKIFGETRIQNCPWILDKDQEWVVTEKIDGTSGTFAIRQNGTRFGKKKYEYFVCSRNRRIFKDDGSIYWAVFQKYRLDVVLLDMITNLNVKWVCIQGECVGPGVQGNKYKLKEPCFLAFNLITSDVGRWSSQDGQAELAGYSVPWVPILSCEQLPKTVEEMLKKAHGQSELNIDTMREGLVCRSLDGQQSFKSVDPEFLIHYGE